MKSNRGRHRKDEVFENKREKILELARNGYTDEQMAKYIGVSRSTFAEYKKKNKEFSDALKIAKDKADIEVENSLYKKAIGYDFVEEHLEYIPGGSDGKTKVKIVKKITKHITGDVTAQIFWLKNRQPKKWRDRQNIEHSGEVIEKIQYVPVKSVKK